MPVLCVLPARIGSRRLPRKPLQPIAGHPLIEWSWRAASRVSDFGAVWVATDSEEVTAAVGSFGGVAVLTSERHESGTERVAEAARREEARGFDVVVNFQADEPFLDPRSVSAAVRTVREGEAPVATLAAPIRSREEWNSDSVVKVACTEDGRALFFTRAGVPYVRDGVAALDGHDPAFLRHIGLYVYTREALERWVSAPPTRLERIERLEQLRALECGLTIRVVLAEPSELGVDEPADVRRAERLLRGREGKRLDGAAGSYARCGHDR
ncbi:MAG: 3-deoxy-manno-octulosonate cytidylyltransferase [Gemmatimonadota bacterium]